MRKKFLSFLSILVFLNISVGDEVKVKFSDVDIKVRGDNQSKTSKCKEFLYQQEKLTDKILNVCEKECTEGNKISCLELGKAFIDKENFKKAEFYFRKACYLNEPRGCTNLGTLYYHGIDGIRQDITEAIKYYQKGCDLGEPKGCHNLGLLYLQGKGVARDLRKAVKALKEACNLGLSPACEDLSEAFKRINRRKSYVVNAKNLFQRISQCMSGNREVCIDIGNYYVAQEDYKNAKKFFIKACYMGEPLGCNNLGLMYFYGYGVKQNFKKAYDMFKKACKMNEAVACNNIGTFYYFGYGVKKDYEKALDYYKKACDMGSSLGCKNLAIMYKYGYGTSIDTDKAIKIYKRGCKQSDVGKVKNYRCEEVIHFK